MGYSIKKISSSKVNVKKNECIEVYNS